MKLFSQEKRLKVTAQAYGICLYNDTEKKSVNDDDELFGNETNQFDLANVMKIVSRLRNGYF